MTYFLTAEDVTELGFVDAGLQASEHGGDVALAIGITQIAAEHVRVRERQGLLWLGLMA